VNAECDQLIKKFGSGLVKKHNSYTTKTVINAHGFRSNIHNDFALKAINNCKGQKHWNEIKSELYHAQVGRGYHVTTPRDETQAGTGQGQLIPHL